jgi:hypothetical protein
MKTRMFASLFATQLISSLSLGKTIKSISDCPKQGVKGDSKLNVQKNRADIPTANDIKSWKLVDLSSIEEPDKWKSGSDRSSLIGLGEGTPVQVTGYLLMVRQGGKEACNCGLSGVANTDLHLVLGKKSTTTESKSVTGEITPRIKLNHPQWTKAKLNNIADEELEVRVTGYVLLDTQHIGKSTPVRSTNWEIHPITQFEVKKNGQWVTLGDFN